MSCVYAHINKINQKMYVGITNNNTPETRWLDGDGYKNQKFGDEGVSVFGWDGFSHTVLVKDVSPAMAQTIEHVLIKKLDLVKNGYNSDYGISHKNLEEQAQMIAENVIKSKLTNSINTGLANLEDIVKAEYSHRTNSYNLGYIESLYDSLKISTDLDCQRGYVWNDDRQQGLWDTLLYKHRIPEIHAIRTKYGSYEIIDGKQRLLTIIKILKDEIPLMRNKANPTIREFMTNANKTRIYFSELPDILKESILSTSIAFAEYTDVSDNDLLLLFQKLNAGKPLSEFQKALANNILLRVKLTQPLLFKHDWIGEIFSEAEIARNEDEILIIRLMAMLKKDMTDAEYPSLNPRDLYRVMNIDSVVLSDVKSQLDNAFDQIVENNIDFSALQNISKTYYPALILKFMSLEEKGLFNDFLCWATDKFPPTRGADLNRGGVIHRRDGVDRLWEEFMKGVNQNG